MIELQKSASVFGSKESDPLIELTVEMAGNRGKEKDWAEVQCLACGKKFMAHPTVAYCSTECNRIGKKIKEKAEPMGIHKKIEPEGAD